MVPGVPSGEMSTTRLSRTGQYANCERGLLWVLTRDRRDMEIVQGREQGRGPSSSQRKQLNCKG